MVEHLAHIEVVDGSNPSVETRKRSKLFNYQTFNLNTVKKCFLFFAPLAQ